MAKTLGNDERFDVILIGSGMGALTTASLLAQLQNKRVLIAEQHFKVGGFTHTFQRKGSYEWDVGVHYVGRMEKGGIFRAVMDYVTGGGVDWNPMPDVYDRIVFPELTFDIRRGPENLKADLLQCFPDESRSIEAYFRDVYQADAWIGRYLLTQALPAWLRPLTRLMRRPGTRLALDTTTRNYLDALTANERLKAVLAAQWGLHGLPPSAAPFGVHAMLVRHYFEGGWYPVGGSGTLAASVVPIIRRHGGEVLVNHRIDEIVVADGRATGVRITHRRGKEEISRTIQADAIVSDAGAYATYTRLLPESVHLPFAEALRRFPEGATAVTVYLGLNRDPAELGLKGENYWIYAGEDHEVSYDRRDRLLEGEPTGAYVSFPSAKDPQARHHTAEIIAFVSPAPFAAWESQPWRRRGADYERIKSTIAATLLAFVDRAIPGFAATVDYCEVSTPLSVAHFTEHHHGNVYALPLVAERFRAEWLGPRTPIRNLYLTGSDAGVFGVVGAMFSGAITAAVIMGRSWSMFQVFSRAMRFSRGLHKRHPES